MEKGSDEFDFYVDSAGRVIFKDSAPTAVAEREEEGYQILTDVDERRRLASEMAAFVYARVTEQYESMNEKNNQTLVFLDKSARPAAWFFKYMWADLYPHIPTPDVKYVNIGQEKGPDHEEFVLANADEHEIDTFIAKTTANTKMVDSLRKVFQRTMPNPKTGKFEYVDETYLDGRDILIVDEHSTTGNSLLVARALFEGAFGSSVNSLSTTDIFSNEPPWLWDENAIGVTDKKPGDFTTRGIRPVPPDTHQLRYELKTLAHEYITGEAT